jgi:hypothetical protein
MNSLDKKTKLNWRRIFLAAATIAIATFTAVAFPLFIQALTQRRAHSVKAVAAAGSTGLSPCEFYPSDIDALIQNHLPSAPTASITASPSFSPTVAIRLVGQDLYYFVLDFPLRIPSDKSRYDKFNVGGVPKIYKTHVSAEIAYQMPLLLSHDIKYAHTKRPLGLDGTYYYFQTSPTNCAMTWSPKPGTRAEKFSKLMDELANRAQSGSKDNLASEQVILATLKSLRSE